MSYMATRPVYLRKHNLHRLTRAEEKLKLGYSVIINEILERDLAQYVKDKQGKQKDRSEVAQPGRAQGS